MLKVSGDPNVIPRLAALLHITPLSIVTPINHASAREIGIDDLLCGRSVQPHFEYDTGLLSDLANRRSQIAEDGQYVLDHLTISGHGPSLMLDAFVKQLLQTRLQATDELCQLAQAIARRDDEAAGRAVLRLYGTPDDASIQLATMIQGQSPADHSQSNSYRYYSDYQIVHCFNEAIEHYGFPGYNAEISPNTTAISVREGKVCVPTGRTLKEVELARLVGHEIESHLRCHLNATDLVQRIIGSDNELAPLASWLAKSIDSNMYEGVAKISDVNVTTCLTRDSSSQQPHPWYVLGIVRALRGHHDFAETIRWFYSTLRESGHDKETAARIAWVRTYRLYRGMSDPSSRNYVFTKDMAYFSGYYRLQRLQTENSRLYLLALDYSSFSEEELTSLSDIYQQLIIYGHRDDYASGNATLAARALFQPRYPSLHLAINNQILLK